MAEITIDIQHNSGGARLLPIVVAVVVYATVLANANAVLSDPDPYLHIVVGRWIIAHGAVPDKDVFSNSMLGAPWVPHEWLSQVVTAYIFDRVGWIGLVIATAVAFAMAIALLARSLLRYLPPTFALIGTIMGWAMCLPHLLARPHILALPLLVVWTAALVDARFNERAPPVVIALMMALWANLHGSYMIGLVLAAMFAGEALFEAADRVSGLRVIRQWGLFGTLSLVATLATPNGFAGLLFPLDLVQMEPALAWINEWQTPSFNRLAPLEIWLMLVLLGALFFGVTIPVTRIVMVLALLHMALRHQRHGEILGLLTPLFVAPALSRDIALRASSNEPTPFAKRLGGLAMSTAGQLVLVAVGTVAAVAATVHSNIANDRTRVAPVAALAAVNERGINGPVFNTYRFGGYLIFAGIAPFIDGRVDMYGADFVTRYNQMSELPGLLAKHGIAWTLLAFEDPRVALLDHLPGWRRLYADAVAVVHIRDDTSIQKTSRLP
jgi:hypothetical protein